jgi:hypothetical protein
VAAARPAASRSPSPPTRPSSMPSRSSAWTSRATRSSTVMIAQGAGSPRSTTSPSCSTAPTAPTWPCAPRRAAWTSSSSPSSAPRRSPRSPSTPMSASTQAKAQEIVDAAGFDAETGAKIVPVLEKLWDVYRVRTRRSSRSTRWSRPRTARSSPSTARSRSTPTPTSVTPTTPVSRTRPPDPLEAKPPRRADLNYVKLDGNVGIIGNGAGLVMSTLDVVAYAGEEFGGCLQAGQLPRHRWRRQRRGHGQRPRHHPR